VRVAYFDSSAIVKLVHLEPESQALIDYLSDPEIEASTSVLAEVEVLRALRRLRASGSEASEAMRGFFLINLDADIREDAGQLGTTMLRTLDAIHLATALAIDSEVEFVTYDERLATTAREHRLRVVQPGRA